MFKDKIIVAVSIACLGIVVMCFVMPKHVETPPLPAPIAIHKPVEPQQPAAKGLEEAKNTITSEDLKQHLTFIASEKCAGRKPGTRGWDEARNYVVEKFKSLKITPAIEGYLQPFNAGDIRTENVIGYVAGTDPKFTKEIIIVGAHLDHLGQRGGQIFYGADDNGSGSVSMLEIAEAVSQTHLKRTVVFMSYSAEEMGLLGSSHYVRHPLFPLENTILMVNLDMVGYLKGKTTLEATGVKGEFMKKVIDDADNGFPFTVRPVAEFGGGSDHAPFGRAGVPIMFLFTGIHSNYHKPTDTIEKVDFKGMQEIARFAFEVVTRVANTPVELRKPHVSPNPNRRL